MDKTPQNPPSMRAIQVKSYTLPPTYTTILPPSAPSPSQSRIKVTHAALHNLVRTRASGNHYTSGSLPHTPGIDGVGILSSPSPYPNTNTTTTTPQYVYFHTLLSITEGSFKQQVNIDNRSVIPLPQGLTPEKAAALLNPAISSYIPLTLRTTPPANFTLLILGATTTSGHLAIPTARSLGATFIIGASRSLPQSSSSQANQAMPDAHIVLKTPETTDFTPAANVDIVLDYLYGPWPAAYLKSTSKSKTPVTWISVGNLAGPEASIPGASLRSRDVTIKGSGPGAWKVADLTTEAIQAMLEIIKGFEVQDGDIKVVNARDVEKVWEEKGKSRIVFTFDEE